MSSPTLTLRELYLQQLERQPIDSGDPWVELHRNHLRQFLPQRYAMLEEQGLVSLACRAAAAVATDRYATMVEAGENPEAAREIAFREVIYPVSEEEESLQVSEAQQLRRDAQEELSSLVVHSMAS